MIKGKINTENVTVTQGFNWVRECIDKVHSKEELEAVLSIVDLLEQDANLGRIVQKGVLTNKQWEKIYPKLWEAKQ